MAAFAVCGIPRAGVICRHTCKRLNRDSPTSCAPCVSAACAHLNVSAHVVQHRRCIWGSPVWPSSCPDACALCHHVTGREDRGSRILASTLPKGPRHRHKAAAPTTRQQKSPQGQLQQQRLQPVIVFPGGCRMICSLPTSFMAISWNVVPFHACLFFKNQTKIAMITVKHQS